MKEKPIIALAVPAARAESVYANYFAAVRASGGEPVCFDASRGARECDGLLLPGGVDVSPARYHQANVACGDIDEALDALQFAALDAFVRAEKPVLGICRGHQLVNVYFGGTLIQHLPTSFRHSRDAGSDADKAHATRALPGGFVAALYGKRPRVNSAHHQAVDALGEGLKAVQWAEDGVVEAIRHEALPIECVQWHPERMMLAHSRPDAEDGSELFRHFMERCSTFSQF